MADLWHEFGGDIDIAPGGDLATASGPLLTRQRVLRRLLTNPGDYIWHPNYGAGLGRYIGKPTDPRRIQAVILAQMTLEATVAKNPPPQVTVTVDAGSGTVTASIRYTDGPSNTIQTLNFNLPG